MTIARLTAAATLTTALAAGGVAYAAGGTGFRDPQAPESPTTTSTLATTSSTISVAPAEETTYAVAGSGSVTIIEREGVLQVTAVAADTGWTVNVERYLGREVEAVFSAATTTVHFRAELEDGSVTTSARTEATTTVPAGGDDTAGTTDHPEGDGSDDLVGGRDEGLPDHVDLGSRPASSRASDQAFAHAGGRLHLPAHPVTVPGVGTLTFSVDDAGSPLVTVNAPGWNQEIDTHEEIEIELTRNDDEVKVRVGADGGIRIDRDIEEN